MVGKQILDFISRISVFKQKCHIFTINPAAMAIVHQKLFMRRVLIVIIIIPTEKTVWILRHEVGTGEISDLTDLNDIALRRLDYLMSKPLHSRVIQGIIKNGFGGSVDIQPQ